jgi:hypothetical protein
MDGKGQAGTKV